MFDQFLGTLLLLLGLQTGGNVRGESTPSAVTSGANVSTASGSKVTALLTAIKANDMTSLQTTFQERQQKSLALWETNHASFSSSLKAIRNENKIALMEKVQNRLIEINKNQTSILMEKLLFLDRAMEKIKKAAETYAEESGKDPSHVVSAIETANKAVADAISKVTTQSEKQYIVSISTEANLKTNVEAERTKLVNDLKKIRDAVKNARKKVGDAYKALKTYTGKSETLMISTE